MHFTDLGLCDPVLQAVADKGYDKPSPIQGKAIPPILAGRDLMAAAQTGTGKTAAFTLPLLHQLQFSAPVRGPTPRVLVLTPTRELAAQVHQNATEYGSRLPHRSAVVFGGVKINPQISTLKRGCDFLVATPGRLLDLHQQGAVSFKHLKVLVLDEADRMLDMGFIHDIRRILALLPEKRQTLMFSATFSADIRKLAESYMHHPQRVEVAPANSTAERVEQLVYPVDKKRKPELLSRLIRDNGWHQVLVFTRTKHGANKLTTKLERDGINAAAIHGNKSQGARTRALEGFKQGKVQALVATDIAARGLDIAQLPQVVNFDLPNVAEDYVHRIGRTGRAGASGHSYSLVSADEIDNLFGIEKLIGSKIPREIVDGFDPEHALPEGPSRGGRRPAQRQNSGGGNGQSRGGNNRARSAKSGSEQGRSNGPGGDGRSEGQRRRRRRRPRPASAAAGN